MSRIVLGGAGGLVLGALAVVLGRLLGVLAPGRAVALRSAEALLSVVLASYLLWRVVRDAPAAGPTRWLAMVVAGLALNAVRAAASMPPLVNLLASVVCIGLLLVGIFGVALLRGGQNPNRS